MNFGRPGVLGLLLIGSLIGCTSEASAPPQDVSTGVAAVPGYVAPSGAPTFCAILADSGSLRTIPSALGRVTVDASDAAARRELDAAVADLRAVLEELRHAVEHADLETAVEDLLAVLTEASGGRLPADAGETVASALITVGELVQPECEFPT